ncbi:MAG: hypothetical protein ABII82_08030 [Verrucomicrobiota bacterium]
MKKLTLTLCIVAILGAAASAFFYIQIGNTKQQLSDDLSAESSRAAALEADLAKSKEQAANLQQKLTQVDSELGDAKSRLSSSEARAVQINRDLTQVRSQLTTKEQAAQDAQQQIEQLRSELVKARLNTTGGSPEELEQYKQTIAGLEARIQELQSRTSSTGAITGNTTTPGSTAAASGETLAATGSTLPANFTTQVASVGPMNAFVVLSFGSNDGAQAGQNFTIVRNGEEIARAQVSEVKEGYAIAQVIPATIKSALRAGDGAAAVGPRS